LLVSKQKMPKRELGLVTIIVAFAIWFSEEIFFRNYFVDSHRKIYFFYLPLLSLSFFMKEFMGFSPIFSKQGQNLALDMYISILNSLVL